MNQSKNEVLLKFLNDSEIYYKTENKYIITHWTDKQEDLVKIILYFDDYWVHFSYEIDKKKKKNLSSEKLLYKNLKFNGIKFALNKKNNIYLLYQIPFNNLDFQFFKIIFKMFLKVINDLYYD